MCHSMSKFHQGKLSPDQGKFREKSGNLIFKIVWPPCLSIKKSFITSGHGFKNSGIEVL